MDAGEMLSAFYKKSCADNRISPTHISLYFALVHELGNGKFSLPVKCNSLMDKAKISSRVTYNRCMRELHLYGYIEYMPSYSPGGSMVKMIELV